MKKNILTILLLLFSMSSFAQVVVSGKVIDADFEDILSGASIVVKGKVDKATITDASGKFSIRMDGNADVVEISLAGYETIKVKLGAITQNLTIFLPVEVSIAEDVNEMRSIGSESERKDKRVKKKTSK
ncbi:MAG: carboxypeptidase-like regulatory domain-containing protein [Bacteroidota bacterium]